MAMPTMRSKKKKDECGCDPDEWLWSDCDKKGHEEGCFVAWCRSCDRWSSDCDEDWKPIPTDWK